MDLYIAPEVVQRFPRIFVGGVIARHVNNRAAAAEAASLLAHVQQHIRDDSETVPDSVHAALRRWQEAFDEAGFDRRYPPSVVALYRRIASGESIPSISPAVDIANAISLKYGLPVGAHDISSIQGSLGIRLAGEGLHFAPPGGDGDEIVPTGELVYADGKEVRTRRWVWRQSRHGRVTPDSTTIFFPIDGFHGQTDDAVRAAADELSDLVQRLLGAKTRTIFVHAGQPRQPILRYSLTGQVPVHGDAIDEVLGRGVVDVITRQEIEPRLRNGEKLRVKLGFDPTGPIIHIGRATRLFQLRQFQQMGHTIIFVVGNFTGMVGDASDKTAKRQMLTAEQVQANMHTYVEQAGKVLDMSRVEVRYNADWLSELRMADVIRMASEFTVAQMIERENFIDRYGNGKPIGLQEFMYPLLQGYDSVVLKSDVEVGGTDQLFNMLAGRVLQRAAGQQPQAVITGPLIDGTNGEKMSTSIGNVINLLDPPESQYFGVMRMRDEMMIVYFETGTVVPLTEIRDIANLLEDDAINPIDIKRRLAREIVSQFHGADAAARAEAEWDQQVRGGGMPDDIPTRSLQGGALPLVDLLVSCQLAATRSEAKRQVEQKSVTIDNTRMDNHQQLIKPRDGMILRAGKKKWARVALTRNSTHA